MARGAGSAGAGPVRGRWLVRAAMVAVLAVTAACDEREVILPGKREDLRAALSTGAPVEDLAARQGNRSLPISLPAARNNADWLQRPGTPATRTDNPALGPAPVLAWSAPIGAGDSRRNRITAEPVVADGRVFTLDAGAKVTATSTAGATLWQADLVPSTDGAGDATGGGLAVGGGRLYVSSGFGRLTALDPATGAVIWQQELQAAGNGAPTFANGVVYLVAGDATAWAIEADTGRIRWQLSSAPDSNNVLGGPAPALTDKYAIFGFGSGEVQGAFRNGGLRAWEVIVGGRRLGYARANISDITGDPVVLGSTVYVGAQSGRLAALDVSTGERLWTADEGPLGPVWVAGGSVFLISDRNELLRLDAATGDRIWGAELPFFVKDRPRRQKEVFAHYGPVLAGGRIVIASNDGWLRFYDPASGAPRGSIEVPGGATVAPVVAGGTLYAVSTKGMLYAYR